LSLSEPLSQLGIILCGDHHTASTNLYFKWYSAYLQEAYSFIPSSIIDRLETTSSLPKINRFYQSLGLAANIIKRKEDLSYGSLWEDLHVPQTAEVDEPEDPEEATRAPEESSQGPEEEIQDQEKGSQGLKEGNQDPEKTNGDPHSARSSNEVLNQGLSLELAERLQYVFIVVGLLTMIYKPNLTPVAKNYDIISTAPPSRVSRNKTWSRLQCETNPEDTIIDIIFDLGNSDGPLPRQVKKVDTASLGEREALRATNLSYYSLTRLAEIEIIWVESIAEHLEFDRRLRKLKFFRFPSFCALLCHKHNEETFLDQ
jgi:hypothetical protein